MLTRLSSVMSNELDQHPRRKDHQIENEEDEVAGARLELRGVERPHT